MSRSVLRGIFLILVIIGIVIVLLLVPRGKPTRSGLPNNDPWILVNYNPDDRYGTYLGNGFFSTRVMGDGVGSQDGKPLPCYLSGLYEGEKMIPMPTWSDLQLLDGDTPFRIDRNADYKQTLNMRTGIMTTRATWRAGRKRLQGKIELLVSRSDPNLGLVRGVFVPNFTGSVTVRANIYTPKDAGLVRLRSTLLRLSGGKAAVMHLYRTEHSKIFVALATSVPGSVKVVKASEVTLSKWVAVSKSEVADIAVRQALVSLENALADPDEAVKRHTSAWNELWKCDIVIDGPRKQQQIIHSCMFYLLCSVREGSKWSIPPMGLSNNAFSGHVFWDADIWMFPVLILQHPDLARPIVEYRYQTLPGAIRNARQAGLAGAQYAWESGYTGIEDTPEGLPYRHERHINGDVALAQWQYYLATGDIEWLKTRGWPVIKETADWWVAKARRVPERMRYEIWQVVPPDESAELVNNSVYTNAIAKLNLEIADRAATILGERRNPKWQEVASKIYIPFDSARRRFIAFDGYGKGKFGPSYRAKQADAELLIYPLQFRFAHTDMTEIYKNTLAFYSRRVHKGGPAMTSSIYSVAAARLGDPDRAYAEFVKSYKPFLRGPFNMFNEKPSRYLDNMCFLTGAAGPIQAILFGMAGIRMEYFDGSDLAFKPCLPRQWKKLTITNLKWRGKAFDLVVLQGNKIQLRPRARESGIPAKQPGVQNTLNPDRITTGFPTGLVKCQNVLNRRRWHYLTG